MKSDLFLPAARRLLSLKRAQNKIDTIFLP